MSGAFWSAGECMLELRQQQDGRLAHAAAGDSFNTAVYLKRLLPAMPVHYVSTLGDDGMSGLIRTHMHTHGIDDSLVSTLPGALPGLYAIATDASGERRFSYWRAQSAARSMLAPAHMAQVRSMAGSCRALLITGISLAILDDARRTSLLELAMDVRAAGGWVVLDNNYRATLWNAPTARTWMERAVRLSTHALFSFDDEATLHGDANPELTVARLRGLGVAEIVVKLGADGCLVAAGAGAGAVTHVAAEQVRAVDTTAAGDSFNAGYLARRVTGAQPVAAARFGCALAGAVVGHRGAIIPVAAMPGFTVDEAGR